MLKLRHREEATRPQVDEERIREDERRRVVEELRGGDAAGQPTDAAADQRPVGDGRAPMAADDAMTARGDGRAAMAGGDRTAVGDPTTGDDWRNTPPASDQPRFDDPRDRPSGDTRTREVADDRPAGAVSDGRAYRNDEILEQRPWTVEEETVTERGFSPGQFLIVLAGIASLVLGIVAVARTGLASPLSQPVKPVLGWDHTALLGLIEIGAGVLLILSGLRAGTRWLGGLIGIAAIVGGALILGRLDWTIDPLGAERDFGWVAIVIGAVAVVGAAIPRIRRSHRTTSRAPVTAH